MLGLDIEVAVAARRGPGHGPGRPGRVRGRRGGVRRGPGGADAGRVPGLPGRRRGARSSAWRPAGSATGDSVKLATVHASKGLQWAAVVRARPGGRGEVAPVPGPAAGDHAVDGEPAAAAVRLAGRCRRTCRRWPVSTPGRWPTFSDACADRDAGRGAAAGLRGGDPGRVLAGAAPATGGGAALAARAVGVPAGGARRRARRARAGRRRGPTRRRRTRRTRRWPSRTARHWPAAAGGRALRGGPGCGRAGRAGDGGHGGGAARAGAAGDDGLGELAADPELSEADQALVAAWARDTDLLLAEREQRRGDQPSHGRAAVPRCRCPRWSPWPGTRPSWPGRSAGRCRARPRRRPRPRHRVPPLAGAAVRPAALIDPDDLPGAADDEVAGRLR